MNKTNGEQSLVKRGDVYWANFDPSRGTEIQKVRPAIILSNNLFNKHLPRVIVVPVTSNIERVFAFDALVVIDQKKGKAMLDQMRAIDKSRLGKKICSLTTIEMIDVDRALKLAVALG